jgi:DNA polymerase-3 subunit beta
LSAAKLASYISRATTRCREAVAEAGRRRVRAGEPDDQREPAEVGDNTSDIGRSGGGPEAQIALNVRYLNDVLGALRTPQVALEMQNSASAGVIRRREQ